MQERIAETIGVMFLYGGPGNGKSFTLDGLVELFSRKNINVAVTATTHIQVQALRGIDAIRSFTGIDFKSEVEALAVTHAPTHPSPCLYVYTYKKNRINTKTLRH